MTVGLEEDLSDGTTATSTYREFDEDCAEAGSITAVKEDAICKEGTKGEATFVFEVSVEPGLNKDQTYYYQFAGTDLTNADITSVLVNSEDKKGELDGSFVLGRDEAGGTVRIELEVKTEDGRALKGSEEISLTVGLEEDLSDGTTATSTYREFDEDCAEAGSITAVKEDAICKEGTKGEATFVFEVSVEPGLNKDQTYYYQFAGTDLTNADITSVLVNSEDKKGELDGSFVLGRDEAGGTVRIELEVKTEDGRALKGSEEISLTVGLEEDLSDGTTATSTYREFDEDCAEAGSITAVKEDAICKEGTKGEATFVFEVSVEPGLNKDQTYYYQFAGTNLTNADITSVLVNSEDKKGELDGSFVLGRDEAGGTVRIELEVKTEDGRALKGSEEISLTVGLEEDLSDGTTATSTYREFDEDCAEAGSITAVKEDAICKEGTKGEATFVFEVSVEPGLNKDQTYYYQFAGTDLTNADITSVLVNSEDKKGELDGSFVLGRDEAGGTVRIELEVKTEDGRALKGSEEISLTVGLEEDLSDGTTATSTYREFDEDCAEAGSITAVKEDAICKEGTKGEATFVFEVSVEPGLNKDQTYYYQFAGTDLTNADITSVLVNSEDKKGELDGSFVLGRDEAGGTVRIELEVKTEDGRALKGSEEISLTVGLEEDLSDGTTATSTYREFDEDCAEAGSITAVKEDAICKEGTKGEATFVFEVSVEPGLNKDQTYYYQFAGTDLTNADITSVLVNSEDKKGELDGSFVLGRDEAGGTVRIELEVKTEDGRALKGSEEISLTVGLEEDLSDGTTATSTYREFDEDCAEAGSITAVKEDAICKEGTKGEATFVFEVSVEPGLNKDQTYYYQFAGTDLTNADITSVLVNSEDKKGELDGSFVLGRDEAGGTVRIELEVKTEDGRALKGSEEISLTVGLEEDLSDGTTATSTYREFDEDCAEAGSITAVKEDAICKEGTKGEATFVFEVSVEPGLNKDQTYYYQFAGTDLTNADITSVLVNSEDKKGELDGSFVLGRDEAGGTVRIELEVKTEDGRALKGSEEISLTVGLEEDLSDGTTATSTYREFDEDCAEAGSITAVKEDAICKEGTKGEATFVFEVSVEPGLNKDQTYYYQFAGTDLTNADITSVLVNSEDKKGELDGSFVLGRDEAGGTVRIELEVKTEDGRALKGSEEISLTVGLEEDLSDGTTATSTYREFDEDCAEAGSITAVKEDAICKEGTKGEATFVFEVSVEPGLNKDQTYYYQFAGTDLTNADITSVLVNSEDKKGELDGSFVLGRDEAGGTVRIELEVKTEDGRALKGSEEISLTVGLEEDLSDGTTATSTYREFDEDCAEAGSITAVKEDAICKEGMKGEATFVFEVSVEPGLNKDQTYYYQFAGTDLTNADITSVLVNSEDKKGELDGSFVLGRDEAGGTVRIELEVKTEDGRALKGSEEISLTVGLEEDLSDGTTATSTYREFDEDCAEAGSITAVKEDAICKEGTKGEATFVFEVSVEPGLNKDQTYYYQFAGTDLTNADITSVLVNSEDKKGELDGSFVLGRDEAGGTVRIELEVKTEDGRALKGSEEISLTVGLEEDLSDGTTATSTYREFDEDCAEAGSITAVKEDAICKEGTKGEATFVFEVSVEPGLNKDQTYYYQFAGTDLTNADITSVLVNSEDKKGELDGSFVLGRDEAGGTVRIELEVKTEDGRALKGSEEISLTVGLEEDLSDGTTATSTYREFDEDCAEAGSITAVKEDAICKEGTKGEATFVFEVSVEPGLNKDQTYYYQFAGTDLTNADITSVLVNSEDKKGELDGSFVLGRDEAGGTVRIELEVKTEDGRALKGSEEISLTVGLEEDLSDGTTATSTYREFDEDCAEAGSITAVKEDAICKEGTKGEATFVFEVSVEPGLNKDQTYYYQFAGTDLTNADITSVLVNSEDKKGELDGSFVLGRDEAGGTVRIELEVKS